MCRFLMWREKAPLLLGLHNGISVDDSQGKGSQRQSFRKHKEPNKEKYGSAEQGEVVEGLHDPGSEWRKLLKRIPKVVHPQ